MGGLQPRPSEAERSGDLARVAADPRYRALVARRARFTWTLTAIMLIAYFGYILLIAFNKELLALPMSGGATSVGIPVGLAVILLAIALTGFYVRRAHRDFDPLVRSIREDAER